MKPETNHTQSSQPHAISQAGMAGPIFFSDNNLFPEAITLLSKSKGFFSFRRGDFTTHLMGHITRHCETMDPQGKEMVEGILSDFGESILMGSGQGKARVIQELLAQLSKAQDRTQFFKALNRIRGFCQTLI